jgi:hypothetical protein
MKLTERKRSIRAEKIKRGIKEAIELKEGYIGSV